MTAAPPRWETSSAGDPADTKPTDLATLGQHKEQCCATSGCWVAVRMGAGKVVDFLSVRLVTTLAALAVLTALVAALLNRP